MEGARPESEVSSTRAVSSYGPSNPITRGLSYLDKTQIIGTIKVAYCAPADQALVREFYESLYHKPWTNLDDFDGVVEEVARYLSMFQWSYDENHERYLLNFLRMVNPSYRSKSLADAKAIFEQRVKHAIEMNNPVLELVAEDPFPLFHQLQPAANHAKHVKLTDNGTTITKKNTFDDDDFFKTMASYRLVSFFLQDNLERLAHVFASVTKIRLVGTIEKPQSVYVSTSKVPGETLGMVLIRLDRLFETTSPNDADARDAFHYKWDDFIYTLVYRCMHAIGDFNSSGWIHRDLNRYNIIVTPDGRVVMIDPELSKPCGASRIDIQTSYVSDYECELVNPLTFDGYFFWDLSKDTLEAWGLGHIYSEIFNDVHTLSARDIADIMKTKYPDEEMILTAEKFKALYEELVDNHDLDDQPDPLTAEKSAPEQCKAFQAPPAPATAIGRFSFAAPAPAPASLAGSTSPPINRVSPPLAVGGGTLSRTAFFREAQNPFSTAPGVAFKFGLSSEGSSTSEKPQPAVQLGVTSKSEGQLGLSLWSSAIPTGAAASSFASAGANLLTASNLSGGSTVLTPGAAATSNIPLSSELISSSNTSDTEVGQLATARGASNMNLNVTGNPFAALLQRQASESAHKAASTLPKEVYVEESQSGSEKRKPQSPLPDPLVVGFGSVPAAADGAAQIPASSSNSTQWPSGLFQLTLPSAPSFSIRSGEQPDQFGPQPPKPADSTNELAAFDHLFQLDPERAQEMERMWGAGLKSTSAPIQDDDILESAREQKSTKRKRQDEDEPIDGHCQVLDDACESQAKKPKLDRLDTDSGASTSDESRK